MWHYDKIIKAQTANDAWCRLLEVVSYSGNTVFPRNKKCQELCNMTTIFPMSKPIVVNPYRNLGYRFLFAEAFWILTGDDRVETIAPFSKHISQFSDDGESFYGAYGPQIMNQSYNVMERLRRDRDTRQAVMTIWQENPPFDTKDTPCTISVQFLIRDGLLHCIDNMRSSDIWLGWPYDAFNFSMLSGLVLLVLQDTYPDLGLGDLVMNFGSSHLYDTDNNVGLLDCLQAPYDEKFCYPDFEPKKFFNTGKNLIMHLYRVSRGLHEELESTWLNEIALGKYDKGKIIIDLEKERKEMVGY